MTRPPRSYALSGRGSDLGLEVTGADLGECLRAAVEGFAAALAELPAALPTRTEAVAFDEDCPSDLLVALLDELIVRLDADGDLAVDLAVAEAQGGCLRGDVVLADLTDVEVHGVAPKAATWHGVRLEPAGDGWSGAIMLDL